METVRYWKTKEAVQAKVTEIDGVTTMYMEGEKYPFPGFPRGHLLFGKLSKLKHEVKNQIFNDSWAKLEAGVPTQEIVDDLKYKVFPKIEKLMEDTKYDRVPPETMCEPVRELYRAWTKVSPQSHSLRDLVCFIMQEDDGYRFRMQWLITFFNPSSLIGRFLDPVKMFTKSLHWIEHAEIIGDMKERQRLLRRILLMVLQDKGVNQSFRKLCKEVNWNKVKMSKADKYFFRAKWFKVDLNLFEY